jgi:TRAP-type C4-dicarboxylate transport system substrate-binding protein
MTRRPSKGCTTGLVALSLALAATGCSGASSQEAQEGGTDTVDLRYSNFLAAESSEARAATAWFERVDEMLPDHTIDIDGHYSGTLLAADASLSGLRSGQADAVVMAAGYYPSQLPLSQIVSVPFMSQSGEAVARAMADMYEENEAFRQEYASQDVIPLVWSTQGNAVLGFRDPVTTLAQLRGKRIRATGFAAPALEAQGASIMALGATEVYEALQQGSLDGFASLSFGNAGGTFRLQEVAPNFVDVGVGQHTLAVDVLMSTDTWEGLPEDVREAMRQAAVDAPEVSAELRFEDGVKACEAVQEAGGSVVAVDEAEVEEWADGVQDDLLAQWKSAAVGTGLEPAVVDEFLSQYQDKLAEYEADASPDALTACTEG